jgi:hypothetical protein
MSAALISLRDRNKPFRLRRLSDLQPNRVPSGPDNNPERQERAALALQIDEAMAID